MLIDYHIHSEFSADSKAKMNEIIEKAIEKGYSEIAFSDHFDLMPPEIAYYGVPSYYDFSQALQKIRAEYGNISILKGVELGEYHRCSETVDEIIGIDSPHIKIGAVHILPGSEREERNISLPLKKPVTEKLIKTYYLENLRLVEHGRFDILAHLGVYKRYLTAEPDESCADDIVTRIFEVIIANDICLEVNLSGLRKPLRQPVPSLAHLQKYKDMGGKLITIGSDTHSVEDFDCCYKEIYQLLTGELKFDGLSRKTANGWVTVTL